MTLHTLPPHHCTTLDPGPEEYFKLIDDQTKQTLSNSLTNITTISVTNSSVGSQGSQAVGSSEVVALLQVDGE